MTQENETARFYLCEFIMVGKEILSDGDQLQVKYSWQEYGRVYARLDHAPQGDGRDFTFCAIVDSDSDQYLLLSLTPDVNIDDRGKEFMVVRVVSPTVLELVSRETADSITEKSRATMQLDRAERLEGLRRVFGEFRSFEDRKKGLEEQPDG